MDTQQIDEIIRRCVADGSGVQSENVIPANTTDLAPEVAIYATVNCIGTKFLGLSWSEYIDGEDPGRWRVNRNAELRYSIQWIGANSMTFATTFMDWIDSPLGRQYTSDGNFSIVEVGEAQNLDFEIPDELGGEYEDRTGLDIRVAITHSTIQEIPAIESSEVNIDGDGITINREE